jgi:antitoxin component YwqK of YwqJK toxin-antitoxin module
VGIVGLLLFTLCVSSGCQKRIQLTSSEISYDGTLLLYQGKRFSGVVETELDAVRVKRQTPYRRGIIHGTEEEFYDNGQMAAQRVYLHGKKVGTHQGWFRDGKRRFSYEYANDTYHGEYWEWYNSGALSTYAYYQGGNPIGRKVWRADGSIYMNYVFPGGRAVGLPGTKLCRQVRTDVSGKTISY